VDSEGGCATPRASAVTQHAIGLIFKHRAGQAWDFQFYRLYKFGYRFDTF
jgi:hypothetical protein